MAREKAGREYLVFLSLFTAFLYVCLMAGKKLLVVELKVNGIDSLILVPKKLSQLDRIHTFPSPYSF